MVEHRVVARKKSRGVEGVDTGQDKSAGRRGSWCAAHNVKDVGNIAD